jgi:hypothetical protein
MPRWVAIFTPFASSPEMGYQPCVASLACMTTHDEGM